MIASSTRGHTTAASTMLCPLLGLKGLMSSRMLLSILGLTIQRPSLYTTALTRSSTSVPAKEGPTVVATAPSLALNTPSIVCWTGAAQISRRASQPMQLSRPRPTAGTHTLLTLYSYSYSVLILCTHTLYSYSVLILCTHTLLLLQVHDPRFQVARRAMDAVAEQPRRLQ
jgi:hypothetical protein